jgi:hypothetical protein
MNSSLRNWSQTSVVAVAAFSWLLVGCSDTDDPSTSENPSMATGGSHAMTGGSGGISAIPAAGAGASGGTGAAGMQATGGTGAAGMQATGGMGAAGTQATGGTGAAGMMGSDAGVMTDAGMMEPEPEPREDLGEGDGSDVITIGDSWMSLGFNGIQQSLVRVSGQPYRTYGVAATRLLNGAIPDQYTRAKNANADIKTVVMTGGGNDIIMVPGLREDCAAGLPRCGEVITEILDTLSALWDEMAADGVQDVIYVQYSNPEGNNVSFMLPDGDGVAARCEATPAPLRCHRLETLDIVMGDIPDGIHPSGAAYDRIGQEVHDMMVERGMRR